MKMYIFFLFVMTASLLATDIPNDYIKIDCKIVPITREIKQQSHPSIPLLGKNIVPGTSTNWSGYVGTTNLSKPAKGSVSAVSGSWIVPTVKKTTGNTYCAIWVGIDGYSSKAVEQIGTAHDIINGVEQHSVWFEMYPSGSYSISGFPIKPGDVISASVIYSGNSIFTMTISNVTQKVSFTIPTSYTKSTTALRNSAEWIVEAPYLNKILPLSNFGTVYLSKCKATINGVSDMLTSKWADAALQMVTNNGTPKSVGSTIGANGSFAVTWKHS